MDAWEFTEAENYLLLTLRGRLEVDSLGSFEETSIKKVDGPNARSVMVDCIELEEISPSWMRTLVLMQKTLEQHRKYVRFFRVPAAVVSFIQSQGVEKSLICRPTLSDALQELGLAKKVTLDVNFINPFLEATMKVLEVQTQTKCRPGQITRKTNDGRFEADLSGVIGLVSDAFKGSVVIGFPEKTFLTVMSRMMGEELKELTKEIEDGAGELTNMIFGQAKLALNEKGYGINTAIPSVIRGKGHSVSGVTSGPVVVVPFETDAGNFFIEICLSI